MKTPIITLWQPWASWIIIGWKTIETRTHPRLVSLAGKEIGIHAGQTFDNEAMELAKNYLTADQWIEMADMLNDLPRSAILGTVFVKEHRLLHDADSAAALINCHTTKRFGLVLSMPRQFTTPIKASGHQGIWMFDINNSPN